MLLRKVSLRRMSSLFDKLFADKESFISRKCSFMTLIGSWEKGQSKPEIATCGIQSCQGNKIASSRKRLSCKGKRETCVPLDSVLGIKMKKAKPTGKVADALCLRNRKHAADVGICHSTTITTVSQDIIHMDHNVLRMTLKGGPTFRHHLLRLTLPMVGAMAGIDVG